MRSSFYYKKKINDVSLSPDLCVLHFIYPDETCAVCMYLRMAVVFVGNTAILLGASGKQLGRRDSLRGSEPRSFSNSPCSCFSSPLPLPTVDVSGHAAPSVGSATKFAPGRRPFIFFGVACACCPRFGRRVLTPQESHDFGDAHVLACLSVAVRAEIRLGGTECCLGVLD